MGSRFDYIRYDDIAIACQATFKELATELEVHIESLNPGRAKSLALTKLEEVYMWIGKAIRDEQLERNPNSVLQEERNNE